MLHNFRRWLFKFLFGFDIYLYVKAQSTLLDVTASTLANLVEGDQNGSFIKLSTQTMINHQESIDDFQKALEAILDTLGSHHDAINKIIDCFEEEGEENLTSVKKNNLN